MLTRTSEMAIQVLVALALRGVDGPLSPKALAAPLGVSPTYLAKVTGALGKAGILRAMRGAQGGVLLARKPEEVTLLAIVEACQGRVLADYCEGEAEGHQVCAFHRAMAELHAAVVSTLDRWTLADLLQQPGPAEELKGLVPCKMHRAAEAARVAEAEKV
jgi:Rrf2 family protein